MIFWNSYRCIVPKEGLKMNIRDIAKLTGVGVSIISRALNNHPDVKESTIEKVL